MGVDRETKTATPGYGTFCRGGRLFEEHKVSGDWQLCTPVNLPTHLTVEREFEDFETLISRVEPLQDVDDKKRGLGFLI